MNRPGKAVRRVLLAGVLLVVGAGIWAYVQASRIPENYRPAEFRGDDERTDSIDRFWDSADEFHNHAQNVVKFEWKIEAGHLNEYLALLDPIIAARPTGWSPGDLDKMMADVGLSEPAVSFGDGVITLMVRSTDYNKILSVDVTIDESLQVETAGTRVGRLRLPEAAGRAAMVKLKKAITERSKNGGENVLAKLILSIDEEPMRREWTVNGKDIRISSIGITPEGMTVLAVPIGRGTDVTTTMPMGYPPGLIPDPQ